MKHLRLLALAGLMSSLAFGQQLEPGSTDLAKQGNVPAFARFEKGTEPNVQEFEGWMKRTYFQDGPISLKLLSKENDQLGETHYRYQQTVNNLPVIGTMFLAHSKNGKVYGFNGELVDAEFTSTAAAITAQKALDAAVKHIGAKSYKWQMPEEEEHLKKEQNDPSASYFPKAELCYYKPLKGAYVLAYRLDIYAHEPVSRQYVFINAQNGNVIGEEERIVHTDQPGTAVTGYSGTQPIVADYTGTTYRLRETGRGNGVETFNLQKGTSYAAAVDFTDSDNVWNNVNANKDQYATDAHFGAEKTYDYFFSKFNRNSIDGNGFKLISYVHYSSNYVNAFWDGSRMTYGDGNTTYNPLTSMDIAGHEITHGLTNFSANLVYAYESGALNESFSDIFGTAIEYYATPSLGDWLVGEDIGAAFRSMSNPNAYSQPDTYLGSYWYTGTGDNGGVHYNSGVQNFWFYLLSVGGSGTNDIGNAYNVPSIGIDKAAAIAFRTLTVYLGPNSQYADARFYSIKAAEDLYGVCSAEAQAVANAWYAVGVGSNSISIVPSISLSGSSSFCAGSTVTLNGNTLPNYQWNLNGSPISGATSSTYTTGVAGVYTLSTTGCGSATTSSSVTLVSNSATAVISANELNSCSSITLNSATSPGYALQWMLNGSDIPGATASSYAAATSGSYSLRIQSTIGPAQTLNSTGAVSIPDNSCPGATSSIATSGLPSAINPAGISVRINLTHTYNGDLAIWLEAPNGDLLGLARGVGGSADNFTNTVFSDAGSAQIPATGAPYTGTYKPWQSSFTQCSATMNKTSFAALGGGTINPNGTWKLRVADFYATDIGTINNWSLTFPPSITPSPDCGPAVSNALAVTISSPTTYYVDADNDGIGSSQTESICASSAPAGYSTSTGDCNDNDGSITAPVVYYVDADNDGVGSSQTESICASSAPAGYSTSTGDCDDTNDAVNSNASEICGNNIDDNCNGQTDEDCIVYTFYADADMDGFGDASIFVNLSVNVAPQGYVSAAGDCNDAAAAINPNATEICNGIDDNCNGQTDEGTPALITPTAIAGPAGVCRSQQGIAFSVASVQGATSYTWTVPTGATIASGQGTNSITVNFSSTQAAGSICVTASNACVSTSALCRNLTIYTAKPGNPSVINGINIENCAGSTRTFSTPAVANASTYTWTIPANTTIVSGQGTNSIVLSFGAAFTSGTLSVNASNCIGVSSNRSITLYSKPGTPSFISGPLNAVCGGSTVSYSCPAVTGAASYNWTVPTGWVINSGQGTTSVSITAPSSYTSASISVAAVSACGSSSNRTVTVRSVPAQPGTISGPSTNLCGGGTFTYSVAAVTGATSYSWTVPANCTIAANNGNSITLSVPANFTSGTLSVTASNA
ncbi:MAG: M4 family metallopeptidase, partial [Bacteroidia bacterium]